jgi:hypothetical protein
MPIRKPERDTEEKRVYNFWWGGSIWDDPKPDELTYYHMNRIYDAFKKYDVSEDNIYTLPDTDPKAESIRRGGFRITQDNSSRINPVWREEKNTALRNEFEMVEGRLF